jgi:hypothetical protein
VTTSSPRTGIRLRLIPAAAAVILAGTVGALVARAYTTDTATLARTDATPAAAPASSRP